MQQRLTKENINVDMMFKSNTNRPIFQPTIAETQVLAAIIDSSKTGLYSYFVKVIDGSVELSGRCAWAQSAHCPFCQHLMCMY